MTENSERAHEWRAWVLHIAKVWSIPSPYLGKMKEQKNHKDDHFLFFKIPSSSVFVLALKFPQISQNSAKSCVVLVPKGQ